MSYVVRLGGQYLQGETGWGERSCASELDERGARAALKLYPCAVTEPCLHAYIDGICHRCQTPEPRVSELPGKPAAVEKRDSLGFRPPLTRAEISRVHEKAQRKIF